MDGLRFDFSYDRWCGWLLGLLGMGRRYSHVTLGDDDVRVVMGWAFRATVPRSSIRSAQPTSGLVLGWGVHGWRGRWLVNGSSKGRVKLTIDPPTPSRVIGFRGKLRELDVSLVDPEGFLRAIR